MAHTTHNSGLYGWANFTLFNLTKYDASQNGGNGSISYQIIGNHTAGNSYTWNLGNETTGEAYESMRCRAIDLTGSGNYSSYYTTNTNLVIGGNSNLQSFQYDSAGNLIQDNTYSYIYNDYNQLSQVKTGGINGSVLEEYYYDENGNRAVKVHYSGSMNETVYYLGDFVRVVNASGVFDTVEYYHGDKLVAERKNDSMMTFYHPDSLGSTSLTTNSTGGVVENTIYEPFGEVYSGASSSRFDYTGKETDDTGLQYFGARYRNPSTIVWTQPDVVIPNIFDPQELNRYAYVKNNPYKYTDPDGRDAVIVNYDLGNAINYQHSSLVVGNDNEGWIAFFYGTGEGYKNNLVALVTDEKSKGAIILGKGKTWQKALNDLESKGVTQHKRDSIAYFETSSSQDNQMEDFIMNTLILKSNKDETSYSTTKDYQLQSYNCADAVRDVLRAGGIETKDSLMPKDYLNAAKKDAETYNKVSKLLNVMYTQQKLNKLAERWKEEKNKNLKKDSKKK
jgi:RHS repeat-associated protein